MRASLFEGDYLSAVECGDGFVDLKLDRRQDEVNKLDEKFTRELSALLQVVRHEGSLRGILLTSAKKAFLAGGDLNVLLGLCDRPAAALVEFSLDNGRVLTALEEMPVPVVVAINGYALGGGLEVALCADYRILASDGQVGFPEVGFGILPAWGGSVRLPRLVGGRGALEWIVGARAHPAEKALDDGVVDGVAEPALLRETALSWLHRACAGELDWRGRRQHRRGGFELKESTLARARESARESARFTPAAVAVVELLAECAALDRDTALRHEADAFAQLARMPAARALIGVFLANQQIKGEIKRRAATGSTVRRAAVLGAGIMGGGIAYTCARHGIPVLLRDISASALESATREIRKLLDKQLENGKIAPEKADAVMASIVPSMKFDEFDTVDLVVEAIVESLEIKHHVLAEVEARVRPGTVLASNTSSLSIGEIAAPLRHPEQVVGMHFFNPVHQMALVEVIRGPAASEEAVATAVGLAVAMGKTPLVVKDCPGFLVNRLLGAYMTAFLRLVHDGVDFLHIDRVMEAWGWPMGPAYLMDVAGIDTLDKALAILANAYPSVMTIPHRTAIQLLAAQGRYGQKTGAGFYRYDDDAKSRPRRSNDPRTIELLSQGQPQGSRRLDDREIEERLMLAMILEAARCLDDGVVGGPAELDLGMRLGTGFPAHRGGPLWYADSIGSAEILRRSQRYGGLGGLYRVDGRLEAAMKQGVRFYGKTASADASRQPAGT